MSYSTKVLPLVKVISSIQEGKIVIKNHNYNSLELPKILDDILKYKRLPCDVFIQNKSFQCSVKNEYFSAILKELVEENHIYYDFQKNTFCSPAVRMKGEVPLVSLKDMMSNITFFKMKDKLSEIGMSQEEIDESMEIGGELIGRLMDLSITCRTNQKLSESEFEELINS